MKLRVLGCSGGIGLGFHTSSYVLDDSILIDAGTGLNQLTQAEMDRIDHVFITHPHLDHIACLPLLLDTTITSRKTPVTVWGTASTIDALQKYIFNQVIWPDFSVIPRIDAPFMTYRSMEHFETVELSTGSLTVVPMNHSICTVGFLLKSDQDQCLMLCGDTSIQESFWAYVNDVNQLTGLIIETAFSDDETQLADLSKHLSPASLVTELSKFKSSAPVYVMHLKPRQTELIVKELAAYECDQTINVLVENQVFEF